MTVRYAASQILPTVPQNVSFNSSYELQPSQITAADINGTIAEAVNLALNFERSKYARGSVLEDGFYRLPRNASNAVTGDLLKVQDNANTSLYTLPPGTTLSRIIYMTEHINGTVVPTSAYILWPYLPRKTDDNKSSVVGMGTRSVRSNSRVRRVAYS